MPVAKEVVYQEVAEHARHYSVTRVSLILFFWSAAGLIILQSTFSEPDGYLVILSVAVGIVLNWYFALCTNTCWLYARAIEEDEGAAKFNFHSEFKPKLHALMKESFTKSDGNPILGDVTNWLHMVISVGFILIALMRWP